MGEEEEELTGRRRGYGGGGRASGGRRTDGSQLPSRLLFLLSTSGFAEASRLLVLVPAAVMLAR